MEEYYSEVPINNSKMLCVGSVTKQEAEESGAEASFFNGFGYYLYVADAQNPRGAVEVIAKLASPEAAEKLVGLLLGRPWSAVA